MRDNVLTGATSGRSEWSDAEDAALAGLWLAAKWSELYAALPGRNRGAVAHQASRLGLGRKPREDSPETLTRLAELARANKPRLGRGLAAPVSARDGVDGKVCTKCGEWKPLGKFARHESSAGGRRNVCTTCEGRRAYASNPTARIAAVRRYQRCHPEQHSERKRAAERRRHGRMVEGPGVPVKELRELFRSLHGLCAYCRSAKAATIDHVVPISKGGKHEIGNILPACRRCNFAKHDFTLQEWINRLRGDS